ncbi:uncharacterized protein AC631_00004 [Debaryomyces fabryi]|uniref:YTH domain-containing protein n=1 Tax=Debaryomyces fabryi TaxID=58627 RepID=A0A0V1Q769_9ASCO|nr:uncharacterized protein AC631_00004 [Debaryomyces fabryi]KSA04133.1 hypothetical protein AC631_00004 [Debaryomyces fabryi]CUM46189.1 unnamed protein product [Debaryomyces fabryi]
MYSDSRDSVFDWDSDVFSEIIRGNSDVSSQGTLSTPSTGNQYCTPRSLSVLETFSYDYRMLQLEVAPRTNIWSTSYRSNSESLVPFDPLMFSGPEQKTEEEEYVYQPPPRLIFRSYRGRHFTVEDNARFFVIKSYSGVDVDASIANSIWASTNLGNKRLNRAFEEVLAVGGKIYLFFLVNCSGRFCGVVEMKNNIDFTRTSDVWVEKSRWKGIFPVEWLMIKDVPNRHFQHLKNPLNESKSVTNSRDTQELPFDIGVSMLKIFSSFK